MSPTELHEAMIKAALEAYDRVHHGLTPAEREVFAGTRALESIDSDREAMAAHLRERLSQVAQAVALEMVPVGEAAASEAAAYAQGRQDERGYFGTDPGERR